MGMPVTFSKTLAAADDDIIAASQTPAGAGNLTLVGGGPVVLDTPRQVILTFAADETGHTFVIYGTAELVGGNPISETIAGTTAGVVATTRMFGTITRISISAAATGAIKAGTNGVGASPWISSNYQIAPSQWAISVAISGTVNYTVQYTYSDFWSIPPGQSQGNEPTALDDPILDGATASGETSFSLPITGWRLLINSGTGIATVSAVQAGISGD